MAIHTQPSRRRIASFVTATGVVFILLGIACAPPSTFTDAPPETETGGESGSPVPTPVAPPLSKRDHLALVASAESALEADHAGLLDQYPDAFTDGAQAEGYLNAFLEVLGTASENAHVANPAPELADTHQAYVDAINHLTEAVKVGTADVAGAPSIPDFFESSGINAAFDELLDACEGIRAAGGADAEAAGLECNPLRP
jgi:hypothetical protein